ncbi:SRPBCC family protein [Micromonospora sp. NPDC048999]|uniref:SRPBCC family protein n=1 Tax=Micromonospora sp. NPDC048999 TaxID=3155391 RepID=UPI0033E32707
MLSSDTFSYTVQARCTRANALALLSDLTRQGELHPLIVRVRSLPPRPGALASYAITDRLELGPLHFPVTYQADVLIATEDEVVTVARQQPATTVRNHTRLRDEPGGVVRVDVEITLSAPAPLFGYAFRQARAAHLGLASRLGAALEGRTE